MIGRHRYTYSSIREEQARKPGYTARHAREGDPRNLEEVVLDFTVEIDEAVRKVMREINQAFNH